MFHHRPVVKVGQVGHFVRRHATQTWLPGNKAQSDGGSHVCAMED
jgi:hypothetical protein